MASILSAFKSGSLSDRRQQQQQQPQQQQRHEQHESDADTKSLSRADTIAMSLASSDSREPFPPLPPMSPSRSLTQEVITTGGRAGTDVSNLKESSLFLDRRTSSRFSRNTVIQPKDRARDRERDKGKEQDVEEKEKEAERRTETASSESGIRGANSACATNSTPPLPAVQLNSTGAGTPTAVAIDPLSQHIFMRTNTDHSIPQRLRNPQRPDSPSADGFALPSPDFALRHATTSGDVSKDKKKSVSFLSRLSMRGGSKKKGASVIADSDSDLGTDGASARVFSQAIAVPGAGGGYIPRHKEPPRYIRTKVYNKKLREFGRMFLAQELIGTRPPGAVTGENGTTGAAETSKDDGIGTAQLAASAARTTATRAPRQTGGAIWATEFSKDGKYLAAGGRDQVVRIWAVISTPEERRAQEEEEVSSGGNGERLSAPVFMEKPFREFEGHTGEILDLSWSKNNFLLSSSMDKTVRLWHISRQECLCTFKHKDFVTRLAFHPRDDRFFLAGSLDTMLRLWSIPDKAIAYSAQLPDLVTAVAFSPDGKTAIAGLLNGLCLFYETEGLKYQTQIHVRSSRGKNAKGSKITGIATMLISPQSSTASSQGTVAGNPPTRTSSDLSGLSDVKVLVTSNDSRIRIYSMRDKSLETKLKGHENSCSQIAATFSDDGKHIICGSEDRKTFIWNVAPGGVEENKDKKPYECFDAHPEIVTTAIFAPTKARILLSGGGDPIFDLCNPPPVTLLSLEEAASATASQVALAADETGATSEPANVTTNGGPRRPEESPAYIARSAHYDGHIIVTTDDTGIIKVFRQDCAFVKRKHETWETASSTFGRKQSQSLGGGFGIGGAGLGRSASILTRTSASSAAHSRRGSLSQAGPPSAMASPHLGGFNGSSDRILSWRQGIEGNSGHYRPVSSIMTSSSAGASPAAQARRQNSDRSLSPSKSGRIPMESSASEARRQPYANSPSVARVGAGSLASPTSSTYGSTVGDSISTSIYRNRDQKDRQKQQRTNQMVKDKPPAPPTPSFSFVSAGEDHDPLHLDPAGASYSFWNLNRWRNIALRNTASQNAGSSQGGSQPRRECDGSPRSKSAVRAAQREATVPMVDEAGQETVRELEEVSRSRRRSLGSQANPTSPTTEPFEDRVSRRRTLPPSSFPTTTAQGPPIPSIELPDDGQEQTWSGGELPPYGEGIYSRGNSIASKLTSELNFERDHVLGEDEEEDEMRCGKCGAREFKAKRVGGKQMLSCGNCGKFVDE